jgi:hypothetical protein
MRTLNKTTYEKTILTSKGCAPCGPVFSFLLSFFLLLFFSACDQDDIRPNPEATTGREILFDMALEPQTRMETGMDFKSAWEVGDEVGIFAVQHPSDGRADLDSTGNYLHNVKLKYNADHSWEADTVLEYPKGDKVALDFFAYYPYDSTATNPTAISFRVSARQDTAANYKKSDLLLARTYNATASNRVQLNFKHAMGMVQVDVKLDWKYSLGYTEYKMPLAVYLRHARLRGTVNLGATTEGNEVSVEGDSTHITMWRVESREYPDVFIYRALVPKQTFAAKSRLIMLSYKDTLSLPGIPERDEYLYWTDSLAAAVTLTPGKVERYNLTPKWDLDSTYTYVIGEPYPHKGPVQGIVYEVDSTRPPIGTHGKIVSPDQSNGIWGENDPSGAAIPSYSPSNGLDNYTIVVELGIAKYPAFQWCALHGEGWYLPAVDELSKLYAAYIANKDKVDIVLNRLGLPPLDPTESYWTSTGGVSATDAKAIGVLGSATSLPRTTLCNIRAIKAF